MGRGKAGRLVLLGALVAATAAGGCRRALTEKEALEAAREEIRREYQPEIDRRKREIAELQQQIEAARKRLAERRSGTPARDEAHPTP